MQVDPNIGPAPARPRLARRVWVGIAGLFGVLALAVGLCIAALISAYAGVTHISELSAAERHAVAIGVAAREQYMHQAHGVLLRDTNHLRHERHWGAMLATHVDSLRPMVGAVEARLLDTIGGESAEMSRIFADEILVAVIAGDEPRVREAHRNAEKRLHAMIAAADASVASLSLRTRDAAALATDRARLAASIAVFTVLAAALVAMQLAQSFAQQIVSPVALLGRAAARIGEGEFDADLPTIGTLEFDQLAEGLRAMGRQLSERETRVVRSERLAAVGALAAGVAHELNNPLGVIVGYLKRIRQRPLDPRAVEELGIVEDETQQCRRIVDDLVALAREPRIDRVDTDLALLVRDTCARLAAVPEVEGRDLQIHADGPCVLALDPTRIAQVTRNLVLNAVAASSPDAPIVVEVRGHGGGRATLVVRDHGSGIPTADLPHVFEPFYSRRSGGTGLGLAVCQRIVQSHGGTIAIESGGEGTTVSIHLGPREETP